MISQQALDELWDFGDPAGSDRRFAAEQASAAYTDSERAELLTQRARALGLQQRYDDAHALSGRWATRATPWSGPAGRLVSLYNNLGCWHADAGRQHDALAAFLAAQDWADRVGTEQQRVWAREAVDECRSSLPDPAG